MTTNNQVQMNVIDSISKITGTLERSQLKFESCAIIDTTTQELASYLAVSERQAMIFSIIFALQIRDNFIDFRSIITFLDLKLADSLYLKIDIDQLIEKDLLILKHENNRQKFKKSEYGKSTFEVPTIVTDTIFLNQTLITKKSVIHDIYGFIKEVYKLSCKRTFEKIDTDELFYLVSELEQKHLYLVPVEKIQTKLKIEDRTLLYEMVNNHIEGYTTNIDKTLQNIYQNVRNRALKANEITEKRNPLFDLELVILEEAQFGNNALLHLTEKSIEYFLAEDASLFLGNKKVKNKLFNEDIQCKELFYDELLSKEIGFLTESLQHDNFVSLQERLVDMKLSKGVAAVFYGAPGTGKTETAYQIAKATGRDLLLVDISEMKSMWFGESEKRIKQMFDTYRKLCAKAALKPILLFNEADALLNKRKDTNKSNVGQTENAIQNILLEEMERFEGIMIATTNLVGNFDAAYERRFLFKVKFETPAASIKQKIWQSKLEWLEAKDAEKLAASFSFSGGEIDNIVKKITMQEVLSGQRPAMGELLNFCQSERFNSHSNSSKVGYV